MNHAGDKLFARPIGPGDQNGGIAGGGEACEPKDALHGKALADNRPLGVTRARGA